MNEETRRAGEAYRDELLRQEFEAQNATEEVTFELPKHGPVSWDTLERCAREAGMPMHDWVADALASYVRMHERETAMRQAEAFTIGDDGPEPTRVPAWKARIAEYAYRLGDWLTDDGTHHEG